VTEESQDEGKPVAFNLRRYENQAKLSVILAAVGGAAAVGVAALLVLKFDREVFFVTYNANGLFLPVLGAGLVGGLAAATVGFFVALNSAGQRRNPRSALSWRGFFLNAAVIAVLLSATVFFYLTHNAIVPRS